MRLIKNILLATDFTKSSENLVETAVLLALNFHSDVYIIHVLPGDLKDKKSRLMVEETAASKMDAVEKSLEVKGVPVKRTFIREGNSAEAIIRASTRVSANLVIVGSSEMIKSEKFKLGTTADKIIRKCDVPVWVVKKGSEVRISKVFCPVDFSEESARALRNAVRIARTFHAQLTIFSVYELYDRSFPRFNPESGGINQLAKNEHERKLESFIKKVDTTGLDHNVAIAAGDPSEEILRRLRKAKPDLLVMGTSGRSGISRWLMGSVAEKVTREVPCSFITVKSENILTLELEHRVEDLEYHYKAAQELLEKSMFREAAEEFRVCLGINDMHIPSLAGIAKAFDGLDRGEVAENYRKMARVELTKMWDKKIEDEIRKHYGL